MTLGLCLCASMALNVAFLKKAPLWAIVAGFLYAAALWHSNREATGA